MFVNGTTELIIILFITVVDLLAPLVAVHVIEFKPSESCEYVVTIEFLVLFIQVTTPEEYPKLTAYMILLFEISNVPVLIIKLGITVSKLIN